MTDHPITPPPELFTEWLSEALLQHDAKSGTVAAMVADKAAQWGADQELEACCEWITGQDWTWTSAQLRAARRPKPPSPKNAALEALAEERGDMRFTNYQVIRSALEATND